MLNFRIFTESKADVNFISHYILEHFNVELSANDFFTLNSCAGYKTGGNVIADIRQNFDKGFQTILILDADNDFNKRTAEVQSDFLGYSIPVHLFLFPNAGGNGNLEDVLTEIAVVRQLIDCFSAYEECVRSIYSPLNKSKIYSYLDALLPPENKVSKNDLRKDENRNYRDTAHWDLHHPYLQPLKDFLSPFFQ